MGFSPALMVCLLCLLGLSAAATTSLKSCILSAVDNDSTLAAFKGDLLYQTLAVKVYNLNYPVTPAAVTFPTSSTQVSEIVQCANQLGYKVQAKSGGHSYANYGIPSPPLPLISNNTDQTQDWAVRTAPSSSTSRT